MPDQRSDAWSEVDTTEDVSREEIPLPSAFPGDWDTTVVTAASTESSPPSGQIANLEWGEFIDELERVQEFIRSAAGRAFYASVDEIETKV